MSPESRIDAPPAVPYFCFSGNFSTLLTGRCGRNCLYLNSLDNKSLAKRSFRKEVLADSYRGFNLATRSSSVSYHECVPNHACQEGRNFVPVHAIWPCVFLSAPVPVAGLRGPGVACFPVGQPSGAGGHMYLSWLSPPYVHVCDDRLRFDPLDRSMLP